MKGELSENDLRYKAEAYCSSMERCVADVEAKLSQWGATPEMMEKIVRHLQDEILGGVQPRRVQLPCHGASLWRIRP